MFTAARREPAPLPPAAFAADVLRAVRREPPARPGAANTLFNQLNRLFPRVALVASVIIALCVATEVFNSSVGEPGLDDDSTQLSAQLGLNAD